MVSDQLLNAGRIATIYGSRQNVHVAFVDCGAHRVRCRMPQDGGFTRVYDSVRLRFSNSVTAAKQQDHGRSQR
jgi:hypothetical protein